jgi:hypothetical protein
MKTTPQATAHGYLTGSRESSVNYSAPTPAAYSGKLTVAMPGPTVMPAELLLATSM